MAFHHELAALLRSYDPDVIEASRAASVIIHLGYVIHVSYLTNKSYSVHFLWSLLDVIRDDLDPWKWRGRRIFFSGRVYTSNRYIPCYMVYLDFHVPVSLVL